MHDGTDLLMEGFAYIDSRGGPVVIAEAEFALGNGVNMTVRAGGGAVTSSPSDPPFAAYEVMLDHDPARFWRRFTDDDQLLYSNVPKMLVAHHAIRRGGVRSLSTSTSFAQPGKRSPVTLPITTMEELAAVLSQITGHPVGREVLRW